MRRWAWHSLFVLAALWFTACDSAPTPAAPPGPQRFLAGTWQGTVTVQVNADIPPAPPPSSAPTTWTFEVVPQTNLQTFRATIHSEHPWLSIDTISTQGDYSSPRGCRGTFGSFGTADGTRIDADFRGADCNLVTFTGHVALTKQ